MLSSSFLKIVIQFWFSICIILLFSSCKKNDENKAPVITIVSPGEGTSFNIDQEIMVEINVSDDVEIKFIKVGVKDENSIAITPSQTIQVNEKTVAKKIRFALDQSTAKSGKSFVTILANDGEKETKKYVEIIINEVPKVATGFITAQLSGTNTLVNYYTVNGEKQNSYTIQGSYSSGTFFSSSKVWVGCSQNSGAVAYGIPSWNMIWTNNSAQIENFTRDEEQLFLLKGDYYTTAYNIKDFSVLKNFYDPNFNYKPFCAANNTQMFCAFQKHQNASVQNKIIVYDFNTSSILKELLLNEEIKSMEFFFNNVFIAHTISSSNQHRIAIYDADSNELNNLYTSGSPVKSIKKLDNNLLLILSGSGLGILNIQTHAFQSIINKNNITDFELENVKNQIYLLCGNQIEVYSLNGDLFSALTLAEIPHFIDITYNR